MEQVLFVTGITVAIVALLWAKFYVDFEISVSRKEDGAFNFRVDFGLKKS